ncbi:uncharacterized protein LOC111300197 [Durio zibethinus]|uniref:Uncharacterized protein LOC111300197 n=1 Tax=Durio zibethinus TaxID=66656 RepID=A0A6P5ZGE9_DURZI|nr:uncharacterized protein LOC111300197 [Durio zibethinus]
MPPKINIFGWRLNNGILPVFSNLRRRGIGVQDRCPICRQEEETIMHAFKRCRLASEIWKMDCWGDEWTNAEHECEKRWLSNLSKKGDRNSLEVGLVTCWVIWHNKDIKNKVRRTDEETMAYVRQFMEEYEKAQSRSDVQIIQKSTRWTAPEEGYAKVNFDGALEVDDCVCGIGVVVKDELGKVLRACSNRVTHVRDPIVAEARALYTAMEFSKQLGIQSIIVEGDALELVNQLISEEENLLIIGELIQKAKTLKQCFIQFAATHIKREGNKAATG